MMIVHPPNLGWRLHGVLLTPGLPNTFRYLKLNCFAVLANNCWDTEGALTRPNHSNKSPNIYLATNLTKNSTPADFAALVPTPAHVVDEISVNLILCHTHSNNVTCILCAICPTIPIVKSNLTFLNIVCFQQSASIITKQMTFNTSNVESRCLEPWPKADSDQPEPPSVGEVDPSTEKSPERNVKKK